MNALDTGILTLTAGAKTINFRNCMIFMTSNAGAQAAQQYLDQLKFLPEKFQKVCLKRMPVSSIIKKKSHAASI